MDSPTLRPNVPVANARHLPDPVAFHILQLRRERYTSSLYRVERVEIALDSLLRTPKRATVGSALARNAYRDAGKLKSLGEIVARDDLDALPLAAQRLTTEDVFWDRLEFADASKVLAEAVLSLPTRHRSALAAYVSGGTSNVCLALGVEARQARNVINAAQAMLISTPSVTLALSVVSQHLRPSRVDRTGRPVLSVDPSCLSEALQSALTPMSAKEAA